MRITAVDEELYTNNTSGTGYGVTMGAKLFSVLTESLYKDKPRAVCRETIANCVDAHRMRDALFAGLTPEDQAWKDLVAQQHAEPGTPYHIHVPTDIEPWLEFEDFGVGLPVEKILGEVEYAVDPQHPESAPVMVLDANGHPVRSGGVYTTLFGSDKEDNDDAIGAYGLGCKSPFAIVDTFLVKSRVGGEEHQYLMFLNSKREPQVDWLTKDPVTGEPAPIKTEKKNGLCVRMDAIPVTMKNKISVSVSDILQTFPESEQPIVNEGMFKYNPVEYQDFIAGLKIVSNFHYGHVFHSNFVVNTGGIVYPVDTSKLQEQMGYGEINLLQRYAGNKCIVIEMPLGTVNIPPSREEISYDEITMGNISDTLKPALDHVQSLKREILDKLELNLASLWKARAELSKLEPDYFSDLIREKWESLIEERRKIGKETGFIIGYKDDGFKAYAQIRGELSWLTPTRDFRIYRDNYYGLSAVNMDDFVLTHQYHKRKICPDSDMLIEITDMTDRKAIAVLNDTQFSRGTVLTRLKKLRNEDLNGLLDGLVEKEDELPNIVVMVGPSNKDVEIKFDEYVKFTEYLCRVGGFNYILGSEICDSYEKMPRKVKHIASSEISRNLKVLRLSGSSLVECDAPVDIFEVEDEDKNYTYVLREERDLLKSLPGSSDFIEYAKSRGLMGEYTFVVNGIRTESRRMCDTLPQFHRVNIGALVELGDEYRLSRLQYFVNARSPLKDAVAEYGLKTIVGALLFSEFIKEKTKFSSIKHFLSWMQVFVNRHPLTSFEENDLAFRKYGPFSLGELYDKIVLFHKIIGGSSLPRPRMRFNIRQERMDNEALSNFRQRMSHCRGSLEGGDLDSTIWDFSQLNITPWKEDMQLLAQLEAVFCERDFKTFHGGVFPTELLATDMIAETELLDSKLDKVESKLKRHLNEIVKELGDPLTIDNFWASQEVCSFMRKLESRRSSCRFGKFERRPLADTRSFYPQCKTSEELKLERDDE